MIKLAALGALGYFGYKQFQKSANQSRGRGKVVRNAVAGGALSDQATVQHSAGMPAR